jgi:hypothetical protein
MKTLENTVKILTDVYHDIKEHSLVVGIPHPGDCTHGTDDYNNVGDHPNDESQPIVLRIMSEAVHDLENKPAGTRQRTSAVNAS